MKKKSILMTIALLCAAVQGAWADTWDGQTYERPDAYLQYTNQYIEIRHVIVIEKASELAYMLKHFSEAQDYGSNISTETYFYNSNIVLDGDIDMGDASWTPLGSNGSDPVAFNGKFYGQGHTIRINISGATTNYQGLFAKIGKNGVVQDLHVKGKIQCSSSRIVGGIAGENLGRIEDCWVSADVSSDWSNSASFYNASVGGIVGDNGGTIRDCCMSGNVTNNDAGVGGLVGTHRAGFVVYNVFYGQRFSTHSQDYVTIGDMTGSGSEIDNKWYPNQLNGDGSDTWVNSQSQPIVLRTALPYPYSVTIVDESQTPITTDKERTRPGKTVTLTLPAGNTAKHIVVRDADGNPVAEWYTPFTTPLSFTMPQRDVIVTASDNTTWAGSGTETDPYRISTAGEWDQICTQVSAATQEDAVVFSNTYFKQTADFTITQGIGQGNNKSFGGIYDGNRHTLTCDLSVDGEAVAPFHKVSGATIHDLHVAGTISGGIHSAGLVAYVDGTYDANANTITPNVTIKDCRVSAAITCTGSDYNDAHGGGFVGHKGGSFVYMSDCLFDGTLTATSNNKGDIRLGAFVGWGDASRIYLAGSVEHGSYQGATSAQTGFCWVSANNLPTNNLEAGNITGCIATNASLPACSGVTRWYLLNSGTTQMTVAPSETGPEYALGGYAKTSNYNYRFGNELYTNSRQTVTFSIDYNHDWTMKDVKVNGEAATTVGTQDVYTYTLGSDITDAQVTATYAPIWDGSGTAESPWLLKNENDFYVMKSYRMDGVGHFDMSGKFFKVLGGTYNLDEDVLVDSRVTVSGSVELNTAENKTLQVVKGFELSGDNSLTLGGTGTLSVAGCDDEKAGIGAYTAGTLVINSGTINVTGGKYAAALGGSRGNNNGGTITINGGVVNVTGGEKAAAIGGGYNSQASGLGICGNIAINGGQVTATAGEGAPAAIGQGKQDGYGSSNSSTLTLSWTDEDDFINATYDDSYATGNIVLAKKFWLDGTTTKATLGNINGQKIVPYPNALVLFDDKSNADAISKKNGTETDVVLYGRKLYRDGKWNTLFLPFQLESFTDTPLEGATVKTLSSSNFENGTLTLTFSDDQNRIVDGYPYIVKWETTGADIEDPVFKNVTIKNAPGKSNTNNVDFTGSFSPVTLNANNKSVLYLGADNTLFWPTADVTIGSCRAYFQLKDLQAGTTGGVRAFALDFGNGEETAISEELRVRSEESAGAWFDLQGRRLSSVPTASGIYINNGKKVAIK